LTYHSAAMVTAVTHTR